MRICRHFVSFFSILIILSVVSCSQTAQSSSSSPSSPDSTESSYTVSSNKIYHDGEEIQLFGVNWFGFETTEYVFHGLWEVPYDEQMDHMQELGFNAVRVPFCPATLQGVEPDAQTWNNPELTDMNSLEVLDFMLQELNERGLYFVLDHHRPDCESISELWYLDDYSEDDWIGDLVFVAERYAALDYFLGVDLKNEPHDSATWGTGNELTDWNSAAERAADAVLAVNSDILIFVEGIQENDECSSDEYGHWWGGNLEPIACTPLNITADKLVLSPHVYGPDVYGQSYFDDSDFPDNMPTIWDQHFGFVWNEGYTVVPGEFGGQYGEADARDDDWQIAFVDYLIAHETCNFFYWSWNPNSGDTGGILDDDWATVKTGKYNNLRRLMDFCSE